MTTQGLTFWGQKPRVQIRKILLLYIFCVKKLGLIAGLKKCRSQMHIRRTLIYGHFLST